MESYGIILSCGVQYVMPGPDQNVEWHRSFVDPGLVALGGELQSMCRVYSTVEG
jgi:hypothetical protein